MQIDNVFPLKRAFQDNRGDYIYLEPIGKIGLYTLDYLHGYSRGDNQYYTMQFTYFDGVSMNVY